MTHFKTPLLLNLLKLFLYLCKKEINKLTKQISLLGDLALQ